MLNRTSIVALAAVPGLAGAALVPTTAAAHRGGGGRGPAVHGSVGHARISHGPVVHRAFKSGPIAHKTHIAHLPSHHKPHHKCHHHHCYPTWFVDWHRPRYLVDVEPVPVEQVAAPLTTPLPRTDNCNCLTKQYLPDGSVLFTDLCTKEQAMATPEELKAQAQGPTVR